MHRSPLSRDRVSHTKGPVSYTEAMSSTPTLVLPDRSIQRMPDKDALWAWAKGANILSELRDNLGQLIGFNEVGEKRTGGRERKDHFLLEDTTWMYHGTQPTAIPLFGSYPQKYKALKDQVAVGFSLATFKRLHAKRGVPSDDGWWVGDEPATVATLPNGSSLLGIAAQSSNVAVPAAELPAAELPNYGAQMVTAFDSPMVVDAQGLTVSASGLKCRVRERALLRISFCLTLIRRRTPEI
jgi:hypothetical protein